MSPPTAAPRSGRRPAAPRCASSPDRKSTRLNSSHLGISYAVFCLKKKKKNNDRYQNRKKSNSQSQRILQKAASRKEHMYCKSISNTYTHNLQSTHNEQRVESLSSD